MVVQEIWHLIQNRGQKQKPPFLAKLDMEKVYDRLRWGFIEKKLTKARYHLKWICWIKFILTLNGHSLPPFGTTNGLK